jgi:hypothetical protein
MFGFLGLMLGVTAGVLTGVAVKGLVDEPLVTGGGAAAFYAAFALSSLLTLFVMMNYLSMSIRVATDKLDIRLGMKSSVLPISDIAAVRVAEPKSRMKTGIEIDVRSDKAGDEAVETWFIASNDPEPLEASLMSAISSASADTDSAETASTTGS